jgi:hypothetical protein
VDAGKPESANSKLPLARDNGACLAQGAGLLFFKCIEKSEGVYKTSMTIVNRENIII